MFLLFIVYIFHLFCFSYSLEFSKESNGAVCNEYFHGSPWPRMKYISTTNTVKLCQTQQMDLSKTLVASEIPFYATLFNTYHRTPVYSANKVILRANETVFPRPSREYWKRVALGLCRNAIPNTTVRSNLASLKTIPVLCTHLQAINDDYTNNSFSFDRGHLTPCHINSRNKEKLLSTFTLTNAAPQYADFNRYTWRIFECVTEYMIIQLVPNEPVYILTGINGSALDERGEEIWLSGTANEKRVKAPGYYWKAVCYPGNSALKKKPWGYAIVQKNVNKANKPNYKDYLTLKTFGETLFDDPPFGLDCMNADFGNFRKVLHNWNNFIEKHCYV